MEPDTEKLGPDSDEWEPNPLTGPKCGGSGGSRGGTAPGVARDHQALIIKVVAEGPKRAQVGKFTLSRDRRCVGRDSGDAVSHEYQSPGTLKGGTILGVAVSVEEEQYLDLEKMAAAAYAVD